MEVNFELQQVSLHSVMVMHEAARSNAAAVIMDYFIVAIDATMWPHTARAFRKKLEETYQKPVKYLFVTHSHGDHMMGNAQFKDATIVASEQLAVAVKRRYPLEWAPEVMKERKKDDPQSAAFLDEVEIVYPTVLFHDQMEIRDQDLGIELHFSGGHTDDSSWAYLPDEKVLFAGDLIFSEWFPYAGDPSCDPERWMAVLRTWLEMPIERVAPGHGPLKGLEVVEDTLKLFEQLKANTLEAIQTGKPAEEIALPPPYVMTEDRRWLIEKTLNRWYGFYSL